LAHLLLELRVLLSHIVELIRALRVGRTGGLGPTDVILHPFLVAVILLEESLDLLVVGKVAQNRFKARTRLRSPFRQRLDTEVDPIGVLGVCTFVDELAEFPHTLQDVVEDNVKRFFDVLRLKRIDLILHVMTARQELLCEVFVSLHPEDHQHGDDPVTLLNSCVEGKSPRLLPPFQVVVVSGDIEAVQHLLDFAESRVVPQLECLHELDALVLLTRSKFCPRIVSLVILHLVFSVLVE